MAMATVVMSVSFASCGDDDDDPITPDAGTTATEATFQSGVYVSETTLKYFDVEVTDGDGNVTKLTLDNTELVTDTVFGLNVNDYKFWMASSTNATDNRLRLYVTNNETLKNFPVTKTFSITATPNGVVPAEGEKVNVTFYPDFNTTNNSRESAWIKYGVSGSYTSIDGISASKWDKVTTLKKSLSITFEKANAISGSIKG